jgi:hypothetical protein
VKHEPVMLGRPWCQLPFALRLFVISAIFLEAAAFAFVSAAYYGWL